MGNLAILVPVHNRLVYTKRFIECLKKNTYKAWTLFVVDDGSTDGTNQMLKKISIEINTDDQVRLLDETIYHIRGDGNWWWTKSVNAIAHVALRSGASLILTQNNDVEIPPHYLERLVEANSINPHAIITAPIFDLNTGDCLRNGGGVRRNWLTAKDMKLPRLGNVATLNVQMDSNGELWRELTHCGGRGCLIPCCVFEKIGLYDEIRLPQYQADDDFTFRAANEGFPILMYLRTFCFTPAEETGITTFISTMSFSSFLGYLTSQKSPANIKRRFWVTIRHCRPRWYAPVSLVLDTVRIVVSYWIRAMRKSGR